MMVCMLLLVVAICHGQPWPVWRGVQRGRRLDRYLSSGCQVAEICGSKAKVCVVFVIFSPLLLCHFTDLIQQYGGSLESIHLPG